MHRRTIVQLSRRNAVDWPGSARLRDAGIASPRRYFHSSLSRLNSSDSPSSGSSGDSNGSSDVPKPRPKFGSRWGPKQTSQAILSPEEQALRNSLLSRSAPPPSSTPNDATNPGNRTGPRQTRGQPVLSRDDQAIRDSLMSRSRPPPSRTSNNASNPGNRGRPQQASGPSIPRPEQQAAPNPVVSNSDPAPSSTPAESSDSSATRPRPQFGSGWGSKQPPGSSVLSPGEQTIRNSLMSKPDPPQSSAPTESSDSSASSTIPKFGRPWGSKQTSGPSALSPGEQAIRDSLKSKPDPPSSTPTESRDSPAPSTTPKFASRWGPKQASSSPLLSPEEQALRSSLLARSTNQQQQQRQPESPNSQQQQRPRRSWGPNRDEQQAPYGLDFGPGRSRAPGYPNYVGDRESQRLQPRKEFELNGKMPAELRNQDWTCPDCGFKCFGKHMLCPRCKARRPRSPNTPNFQQPRVGLPRNPRSQDWKPRHLESRSRSFQEPGQPRPNTIRDLRLDNSADHRGSSIGESMSIRKVETRYPELAYERESAQQKHEDARIAEQEIPTAVEPDKEAIYWGSRRSKFDDRKRADETERGEYSGRDKKSSRRGGQRGRESEQEDEFDVDEYHQRRQERKKAKKDRARERELAAQPEAPPLYLPHFISVSNFADVVGMRPGQLVRQMEEMGFEDVTNSHVLDAEVAGLIAAEFGYEPIFDAGEDQDLTAAEVPEDQSMWPTRPPVVTIMGHVDHGKTTILDWLRKSSVVASEHGGITQHIGAFSVAMPSGKSITFLDTPGHAAFLDMRRRGADVTDIVVLVVAADDSVKPQTIEAIKHATSAKVPIIVAMSKIDKEGIDPQRVKADLSTHGIHVEDFGGDVQAIGVSGKTGLGMLELEEAIVTLSEVLDHRADAHGVVEGWVIEGTTKSYGRVATVLVRRGTLRPGDILVAGSTWTRVRTLRNEAGVSVSEATPGTPVEIDGWREAPTAGTEMLQADDEQHAKEVVEHRLEKEETQKLGEDTTAINESRRALMERRQRESHEFEELPAEEETSGPKPVNFVLKADVDGSAEAVLNSVTAVGNNEVYARVLRSEVGHISESDIELAAAANGHIISFNQHIDAAMSRMAEGLGVEIMDHNIIYKLVDEVKERLSEKLPPTITQRVTGEAEIGQIFEISLKGRAKTSIAGCKVRNGMINRTKKVRVMRGQKTVYDGSIDSLKNVKKDVTEMRKDTECGIGFENWTEFAVGDQIQCYEEVSEKRTL